MKGTQKENEFRLELLNYKQRYLLLSVFILLGVIVIDLFSFGRYSFLVLAIVGLFFNWFLRRSIGNQVIAIVYSDKIEMVLKPNMITKKKRKIILDFEVIRRWEMYSVGNSDNCLKIELDHIGKVKYYFHEGLISSDFDTFSEAFALSINRYSKKILKENKGKILDVIDPDIKEIHPINSAVARNTPQRIQRNKRIAFLLVPGLLSLFFLVPEKVFPMLVILSVVNLGYIAFLAAEN